MRNGSIAWLNGMNEYFNYVAEVVISLAINRSTGVDLDLVPGIHVDLVASSSVPWQDSPTGRIVSCL